jgi:hypothetical protein
MLIHFAPLVLKTFLARILNQRFALRYDIEPLWGKNHFIKIVMQATT